MPGAQAQGESTEYTVLGYSWRAPTPASPVPLNVKHETAPGEEVSGTVTSAALPPLHHLSDSKPQERQNTPPALPSEPLPPFMPNGKQKNK